MHLFVETEVSGVERDRRVDVFDDVTDAHCGHSTLLRVVFPVFRNARNPRQTADDAPGSLFGGVDLGVDGPDQKVEDSHLREPVIAAREFSLDLPQGGAVAIQVLLVTAHERGGVLSERPR